MYTSEPISSQIIIKQQLEAHYKKLQSVKSYIDNKVPYTLRHHPKSRAQLHPQFSARYFNPSYLKPLRAFPDHPYIEEIVRSLFKNDANEDAVANRHTALHRVESRHSSRSRASSANSTCSSRSKNMRELSGDVLDRQSQKFTPGKSFTPRTLKSTAVSRIRSLDCYNPPKRSTQKNSPTRSTSRCNSHSIPTGTGKTSSNESKSTPKPRPDSSRSLRGNSTEKNLNGKSSSKYPRDLLQEGPPAHKSRVDNLETEVEFLNFLSSITSDILIQGSFTNEQLIQLFKKQLCEGNSNLSLDLKRRALRQIVDQLHLPPEVSTVIDESSEEVNKLLSRSCNGDVRNSQNGNGKRQKQGIASSSEVHSQKLSKPRACLSAENIEVEEAVYISNALSTASLQYSSSEDENEIVYSDDDMYPFTSKSPQLVQIRTPILTLTPAAQLSDSFISTGSSARKIKVNKSGDSDVTVILTEVTSLSEEGQSNSDQISSNSVEISVQEDYVDDFSD